VALPSFDVAVDEYFSVLERARAAGAASRVELRASRRVGRVEGDFRSRGETLAIEQDSLAQQAAPHSAPRKRAFRTCVARRA